MLARALPRYAARRAPALKLQHARAFSSEHDFTTNVFDKQPYTVSTHHTTPHHTAQTQAGVCGGGATAPRGLCAPPLG